MNAQYPDIRQIKPQQNKIDDSYGEYLGELWPGYRDAEIEAAIAIIETNPDRELFFILRDAYRLGAVIQLIALATNDQDLFDRVHMITVNRESINSNLLRDYIN